MYRSILTLCLIILSSYIFAAKIVKSKLVDKRNQPIIGAIVLENGTKNYAISDTSGNFKLMCKEETSLVQIMIFGFDPIEVEAYQMFPIIEMRRNDKYPLIHFEVTKNNIPLKKSEKIQISEL
jgi:hypothetical protein